MPVESDLKVGRFILVGESAEDDQISPVAMKRIAVHQKDQEGDPVTLAMSLQNVFDAEWLIHIALSNKKVKKSGVFVLMFGHGRATLVLLNDAEVPTSLSGVPCLGLKVVIAPTDSNSRSRLIDHGQVDSNQVHFEHLLCAEEENEGKLIATFIYTTTYSSFTDERWETADAKDAWRAYRVTAKGKVPASEMKRCKLVEEALCTGRPNRQASSPSRRPAAVPQREIHSAETAQNRKGHPKNGETSVPHNGNQDPVASAARIERSDKTPKKVAAKTPSKKPAQPESKLKSDSQVDRESGTAPEVLVKGCNPRQFVILASAFEEAMYGVEFPKKYMKGNALKSTETDVKNSRAIARQIDREIAEFHNPTKPKKTPTSKRQPKSPQNKPKVPAAKPDVVNHGSSSSVPESLTSPPKISLDLQLSASDSSSSEGIVSASSRGKAATNNTNGYNDEKDMQAQVKEVDKSKSPKKGSPSRKRRKSGVEKEAKRKRKSKREKSKDNR